MRKKVVILAGLLCVFFCGFSQGQGDPDRTWWQLTLAYSTDSLRIVEAVEIPLMQKKVETPGLRGAPFRAQYNAEWLSETGQILASGATELPLGIRGTLFSDGPVDRSFVPSEGVMVVRLKGPLASNKPSKLRLRKMGLKRMPNVATADLPSVFAGTEVNLDIPSMPVGGAPMQPIQGPISVTKIQDTGPDSNRYVMVILGDGYTASDLAAGQFTSAVNTSVGHFNLRDPWTTIKNGVNIYRIDVESNQSGADRVESSDGPMVDTFFGSTFWWSNVERVLQISPAGHGRAINAANYWVGSGVWDFLIMNVNSTKYGGSGSPIVTYSNSPDAGEILLHEVGHVFPGLADEYTSVVPGYPEGDSEPNVDYDFSGPGLKWLNWVEAGTPLPTPDTSEYDGIIGAFEGARYKTTGIYRPYRTCGMRYLNVPFCPVCIEAHLMAFFSQVKMVDQVIPAADTLISVPAKGQTFSVSAISVPGFQYEWTLNGILLPEMTQPTIVLPQSAVDASNKTLQVRVSYPTARVRKTTFEETCSWTVKAGAPAKTEPQWSLYR